MIKSIMGGMAIGMGASFYLVSGNPIAFSLGIIIIVSLNLSLITGYIPSSHSEKNFDLEKFFEILIGNLVGAALFGIFTLFIPFYTGIQNTILTIVATKSELSMITLILSGILTGILIGFGVIGFKRNPGILGLVTLLFCITAFVVLKTEHVIANMFYLAACDGIDIKIIVCPLIGNIIGGLLIGKNLTQ